MNSKISLIFAFLTLITFAACESDKKSEEDTESGEESKSISISAIDNSPEFPDAMLEMMSPGENQSQIDAGEVSFAYEVKNYQLTAQTLDAEIKKCANSPDGQHIHLILNNEPYTAHYSAEFTRELKDGHYVALSFLSRSYHESLKNYGAFNLRQFTVGREANENELADLNAPHLFYSRPKGEYKGKEETERVILDFYLINTDLAADGNKVKAKINDQEFLIDEWKPYFMEGLPLGENTVELELVDKDGNFIEGPFNKVKRTFTLKE